MSRLEQSNVGVEGFAGESAVDQIPPRELPPDSLSQALERFASFRDFCGDGPSVGGDRRARDSNGKLAVLLCQLILSDSISTGL